MIYDRRKVLNYDPPLWYRDEYVVKGKSELVKIIREGSMEAGEAVIDLFGRDGWQLPTHYKIPSN